MDLRGGETKLPPVLLGGGPMQGCAERAAAQHAPHTPNISLHGARYAAGTQQLSAALKQSSHRASWSTWAFQPRPRHYPKR